jgi:hypothetical protein
VSVRAERIFIPELREVEREMALPIPDRVRFLRELEYDLEELSGRLIAEGVRQEEAIRRAREALVPDRATLEALELLHAPWYVRVTRHLSPDRLRLAERGTLAVATTVVVAAQTAALLRADLLGSPSPFLFPVLVLGGVLFATVLWTVFELLIKGNHAHPTRGLFAILGVSTAALATGTLGAFADFYRLSSTLERAPELADTLATAWLVAGAALLSVALVIALAGGLAWFALARWVAVIVGEHRALLGIPHPSTRRRRH